VEKYCRAGQATDDDTAHAFCMLDTQGYKYTQSGCVILIACPLQQWLHERVSELRYTYSTLLYVQYIASFVLCKKTFPGPDCNITVVGKSVSTNVAGPGTTYEVTSGDDSIKIVIAVRNYCGGTQEKELLLKHAVKRKIRFGGRY
jgi:hypothetical protein